MNTYALLRAPAPLLIDGERTFIDREPIQFSMAQMQHDAYAAALLALGISVEVLAPLPDLPDSVFVEDTAVVLDEVAILGQMGAASRKAEIEVMAPTLGRFRNVVSLPPSASLEGGDVMVIGNKILVGQSRRTNTAGLQALQKATAPWGYQVIAVPVHGCLHLKTACTALPDQRLLLNPRWVDASPLSDFACCMTPQHEPWAACQLSVHDHVILDSCHEATIEMLHREGYSVLPVDLSEFAKAEAGPTCLSLVFQYRSA
jgi:dimethylargininase